MLLATCVLRCGEAESTPLGADMTGLLPEGSGMTELSAEGSGETEPASLGPGDPDPVSLRSCETETMPSGLDETKIRS